MGFAEDLQRLCDAAGEKASETVRRVGLELYSEMIDRSPVGNPDLWQANKQAVYMRETYNVWVDAINADIGKGKGRIRKKSAKNLRKTFPNAAGQDYVGGRFKNNWQVGIGGINNNTDRRPQSDGNAALAAYEGAIRGWTPGATIFLTNSMPYARALEYGHSQQAPGGMVRLTVQNYSEAVARAAAEVRNA